MVELFTSQGCSSCPPANANLIKLSERRDVLTLSFAVTYWDYLGWKDLFGKPEFTDRQRVYEPALGERGPYTPQMVVNGLTTAVGNNLSEVEQLISGSGPHEGPAIQLRQGAVEIGAGEPPASGADVWLVQDRCEYCGSARGAGRKQRPYPASHPCRTCAAAIGRLGGSRAIVRNLECARRIADRNSSSRRKRRTDISGRHRLNAARRGRAEGSPVRPRGRGSKYCSDRTPA